MTHENIAGTKSRLLRQDQRHKCYICDNLSDKSSTISKVVVSRLCFQHSESETASGYNMNLNGTSLFPRALIGSALHAQELLGIIWQMLEEMEIL
jgi:hypothetical protein